MSAKKAIARVCSILLIIVMLLEATPLQGGRAAGRCYVKGDASGTNTGTSWKNAYTDLQSALGTSPCLEIWVAAGTYKPTALTTDRNATFQLKDSVTVYGGFAGTETVRTQPNPAANPTIRSGDIDNNDSQTPIITNLATITGNTTNSYHVVTGQENAYLAGFTITAGFANGASPKNNGGGMFNNGVNPILVNVSFNGNAATGSGGGLYSLSSDGLTAMDVTFNGNSADKGGGMFNEYTGPIVMRATFSGNAAANGGGMYNSGSYPSIINATFSGNSASNSGGGMYNSFESSSSLMNVTLSGNSAGTSGGGIYNSQSGPDISESILWGNTAPSGPQIFNLASAPLIFDSVIQDGCPAGSACETAPITADPKLGTLGDYGGLTQTIPLLEGSSAIDKGDNAGCDETDQRGVKRPQGLRCDLGAYEYYVDTTAPMVTSFTVPTVSHSFTVPITGFTATDAAGVTGYMITTSASPPAADAAGWTISEPITYTVASDGTYTLYPWARDWAGNVSALFGSPPTVVVTIWRVYLPVVIR